MGRFLRISYLKLILPFVFCFESTLVTASTTIGRSLFPPASNPCVNLIDEVYVNTILRPLMRFRLSSEERESIKSYISAKDNAFTGINFLLRDIHNGKTSSLVTPWRVKTISNIDSAMKKMPPIHGGRYFRGISNSEFLPQTISEEYFEPGFISVSRFFSPWFYDNTPWLPNPVDGFAYSGNEYGAILIIDIPKTMAVRGVPGHIIEFEYVLQRGLKFRLTDIKKPRIDIANRTYYYFEVVEASVVEPLPSTFGTIRDQGK